MPLFYERDFSFRELDPPTDGGGGSGGTDGGTGGGGGGVGPQLTPAVVIGTNLQRDNLAPKPEELAPAPTMEALSKDRRKRAAFVDPVKKSRPTTSGINL